MQKQVEYSDAIKTKYPEQVVIAIAKDAAGKANPVTLGWTMIVSGSVIERIVTSKCLFSAVVISKRHGTFANS